MDGNGRDRVGRFADGHAGGPGRPKGFRALAAAIDRATGGGLELVEWALGVFRDPERTHAERSAAHAWLGDRGYGKPVNMTEMSLAVDAPRSVLPVGFDAMPREAKLAVIADIRARALAGATLALGAGDDE